MRWIVGRWLSIPLASLLASTMARGDEPGDPGPSESPAGVLRLQAEASSFQGLTSAPMRPGQPPVDPGVIRSQVGETVRAAEVVSKDLAAALDGVGARSRAEPVRPPAAPRVEPAAPADAEAARAEVMGRLKALDKEKPAGAGEVREVLEERLRLLKEWDRAAEARRAAENPEVSPGREAEGLKAELAAAQAGLARAAKDPDALLPEAFRVAPGRVAESALKEMKEAIDAAENAVRDRKAALDGARADGSRQGAGPAAALRAEREAARRRREDADARKGPAEAALAAAKTVEDRALARDRLGNVDWEARVASERLRALDAALALETRRESLGELRRQGQQAAWELAERAVERMRARYRASADHQQGDLTRQAAAEQARAARAADPLERYRARRAAELLDLESQLLKDERALAARPAVSPEEQAALADRAEEDFARLKKLVEGGRSGALVAQRLNTSYRRTISERERLVRTEQARAAAVLEAYENALTGLELDILNDARDERAALDALLEALPPARRPAALSLAADLEARHRVILADRRLALQRLVERAEATQQQLNRRLHTLDEQHAFIRTRIFWVRDAQPIGPESLEQVRLESQRLSRAILRLPFDPAGRPSWGRASWEFTLACAGLVVLPWPLVLTGRALRSDA